MKKIDVFVVDDEIDSVLETLNSIPGFRFVGASNFDCDALLEESNKTEFKKCTVLLLDIINGTHKTAGIDLFRKLGERVEWKNKKGTLQIVFFSNEPSAIHEYEVAKGKIDDSKKVRARRIDLSGYLDKKELFEGGENAVNILRSADRWAKLYKDYPSLADPILNECEIIYSPQNNQMREVMQKILLAGKCDETVLIQGETGTGKELVAKAIWEVMQNEKKEDRLSLLTFGCDGPLLKYNIGSAPTEGNLQYTELFGALKESYSGCSKDRIGLFEKASKGGKNGGTIFLDEIGDAHPSIQVALLRVLQEKTIIPLGGFNSEKHQKIEKNVNFRLITGSHVDLEESIRSQGGFRADLFYRLNAIQIRVLPLRERKEDIRVLVYLFLEKMETKYKRNIAIKDEAKLVKELESYDWPGNVRQLEMAIRSSYIMSPGKELILSNDVQEMLTGRPDKNPIVKSRARKVFEELETKAQTLASIAKKEGVDIAKEVGRLFVERFGQFPNNGNAEKYFDSTKDAVRKWLNSKGISSMKIKGRRGR